MKFFVKLPRGSPGPLTPSPALTGTTFFFQDSIKGLEEHGESLPGSWCPFLKSLWTWWIMIKLEMVSGGLEKPKEPSLKLLLRSNLWSPVKTIHFLYGPLWSLGGYGGSWQSWKWCQGVRRTPRKVPWKFHKDQTSGTLSRLKVSFKSLMESWRTLRFKTKLVMVSGDQENP